MNFKELNIASYGTDIFISPNVEIRRPHLVRLGSHIAIDSGFYCTTALEIGDYIHIAPYTTIIGGATAKLKMDHFTNISVGGRIICGSDEFLGEGLITAPGIPDGFRDRLKLGEITFEMFANVGANVTILPGVTLAQGSVIGACSLVIEDTEPWTIYVGVPARPIKIRPKEKMIENAQKMGYHTK
jgi:galactoside O-acetyltransferase